MPKLTPTAAMAPRVPTSNANGTEIIAHPVLAGALGIYWRRLQRPLHAVAALKEDDPR